MQTRGSASILLVDTSVAVALVSADHSAHDAVVASVGGMRLGLAGHAAFETFSVLTRLPPPARRSSNDVDRLLESNFPESRFLGEAEAGELLARLPTMRIAGGSVYDALVGSVAVQHRLTLVSRDRRAESTYRMLGVDLLLL